jgi:hypothetical protein
MEDARFMDGVEERLVAWAHRREDVRAVFLTSTRSWMRPPHRGGCCLDSLPTRDQPRGGSITRYAGVLEWMTIALTSWARQRERLTI